MKPKTMILMGLAITCGLGASYMTSRLLADRGQEEKETVEVLVARRNLSVGERVVKPEELFEKKTILRENDTPDSIRDFDALKGKILKQGRNKGDAITPANMFSEKEMLEIPENFQAMGLRVNLETSAHGLATLPHSRVDLIWFQRGEKNETSRVDVLLRDVLVLAADGKIDREGMTAVAQVVTLALTPEQVLKVNLAKETGILNLSLRKFGDKGKEQIPGISGDELRKNLAKKNAGFEEPTEPKVEVKLNPERPATGSFIIENGTNIQRVEYQKKKNEESPSPDGGEGQ